MLQLDISNKLVCHTSGSISSEVFTGIKQSGAYGCSIHPMHAFATKDGSARDLENAYFAIEGDKKALDVANKLFNSLGNWVIRLKIGSKTLYHLASVTVSNLVLALISLGVKTLENSEITSHDALHALMPLIKTNIENIE